MAETSWNKVISEFGHGLRDFVDNGSLRSAFSKAGSQALKFMGSLSRTNKLAAFGIAAMVGVPLMTEVINKLRFLSPRSFEDGPTPGLYANTYEAIRNYHSDFGSGLNLSKTAHKVLVPHPSSTKRGRVNIPTNLTLNLHKNKINHMVMK